MPSRSALPLLRRAFGARAKAKPSQEYGDSTVGAMEKRMLDILRPVRPPPPKTPEEKAEFREKMIRYGKLKRAQHIDQCVRTNKLLLAKWTAIDALPHKRRVEALFTPPKPLPKNRPLLTDTPPIKGFNGAEMTKSR